MKTHNAVTIISAIVILLAVFAAGVGLLDNSGTGPGEFVSVRGSSVKLYGHGFYKYDTPLAALSFKGSDGVTLFWAVPVMIVSLVKYRRQSIRGALYLAGAFGYMLYNYMSMSFGSMYNNLFIIYIAIMSLSLFGVIITVNSIDIQGLPKLFAKNLPVKGVATLTIITGIILLAVWLGLSILPALFNNTYPMEAEYYSTFVTGIIDVGLVGPIMIVSGILLLKRKEIGYLLGAVLIAFTTIIGMALIAGGVLQLVTKTISVGQAMGFTVPFVILTLFAIWFATKIFGKQGSIEQ